MMMQHGGTVPGPEQSRKADVGEMVHKLCISSSNRFFAPAMSAPS